MTPYELMILLDVYVSGKPRADCRAPIYYDTISGLIMKGLIVHGVGENQFLSTDKFKCLLDYILNAPEPVWCMPSSKDQP